jgi:hypothetical protein
MVVVPASLAGCAGDGDGFGGEGLEGPPVAPAGSESASGTPGTFEVLDKAAAEPEGSPAAEPESSPEDAARAFDAAVRELAQRARARVRAAGATAGRHESLGKR